MPDLGEYLLRVEAVNFDAVIADTGDLSAVRGGGLLLLDAIEALGQALRIRFDGTVDTLASGASVGLFLLKTRDATAIRDFAADWLCGKPTEPVDLKTLLIEQLVRFATFVCDVVPLGDDLLAAREAVIAVNRVRALRELSVRPARPGVKIPAGARPGEIGPKFLCTLDPTFAAFAHGDDTIAEKVDGETVSLSDAVLARRRYGRVAKREVLYRRMRNAAGRSEAAPEFAWHFGEIADPDRREHANLKGKIAVIYADGNGFAKIERRHIAGSGTGAGAVCEQKKRLQEFDKGLQRYRANLFLDLVEKFRAAPSPGDWSAFGTGPVDEKTRGEGDCVKLETLLWGGDEFLWVVPASLGMATVNFLVEATGGWQLTPGENGAAPTHAVGAVFCHHNAPIQRVRAVADDLALAAKSVSRKHTLIAYEVLESFDFPGRDLAEHRREATPRGFDPADLVLPQALAAELPKLAQWMKGNEFPRRRLHRLAHRLYFEGAGTAFREEQAAALASTDGACDFLQPALKDHGPLVWYHLNLLWDYLMPLPVRVSTGAGEQAA